MPAQKRTQPPTLQKVTAIVDWLLDKKAQDLLALDLSKESGPSEAVVIVTATSIRHGQGLAEHILHCARKEHFEYLSMEGHVVGQWILLDLNDIVIHIFQPEPRELYRLDDLWPTGRVVADTRKEA